MWGLMSAAWAHGLTLNANKLAGAMDRATPACELHQEIRN